MIKGFREFIARGNVIDLAVAVVIGAAFGALVTSLVEDLLTPIVAALIGKPDFSDLTFEINGSVFRYGEFINAVIAFLTVAAAIYFFVVAPLNRFKAPAEVTTRNCPECATEIPLAATRCPNCTTQIPAATPEPSTPT